MDAAQFQAAGLYDPAAPRAAERLELLEWLAGRGVTLAQMVRAARETSLSGVAGDLVLRPPPRLTLAEVAERAGLTPERVEEILFAAGIAPVDPEEPAFSEDDAPSFAAFAVGAATFGDEATRRFSRIIGSSLARIAEAAVSLFLVTVEGPIRDAAGSELALAQANLRALENVRVIPTAIAGLFRTHIEHAIRRLRQARSVHSIDSAHLTVGFVDLVGFTTMSRRMTTRELGAVVDRFEDTAHAVVTARDGRVVKLIGDEVMFVTLHAAAACDIALTLVSEFAGDPAITPRGGLASGELLVRGGDYYGPVVNLASRLAELAVPKELLVTREVAEQAASHGLHFEPAGKRLLKGFDEPVTLFAVER